MLPPIESYYFTLILIALLVWLMKIVFYNIKFLHIFQLEGYKNIRFFRWAIRNPREIFSLREIYKIIFPALMVLAYFSNFEILPAYVLFLIWIFVESYMVLNRKTPKAKKKLVYTARAKRILVVGTIWTLLIFLGILGFSLKLLDLKGLSDRAEIYIFLTVFLFVSISLSQGAFLNIVVANFILFPVEKTICLAYLLLAKRKINLFRPKVIGITGSYGKTSTKYILETVLSKKFKVLKTPESYNTLMGICKVINNDLSPEHEIFIVEMGAYKRGDIEELCELAHPEIGIITSVGPQHLERFRNIDNIIKTKYELIESLPEGGIAILNYDEKICQHLADKTNGRIVVRYGIQNLDGKMDLVAENIKTGPEGVSFSVSVKNLSVNLITFKSKLLGKNNIYNILSATAVALKIGMTLGEISRAVEELEPIPHRLQLLSGARGVTIIDDSYNSNPIGAAAALDVLKEFTNGKKVLVTPGMIELDKIEFEENKKLGIKASEVCDFVFLVGPKRTLPILQGLKQRGFPANKIKVVTDLSEVIRQLKNFLEPGDVVLFENDLPDIYNETV